MGKKIDGLFAYVIVQFELIMDYFLDVNGRIESIEIEIEDIKRRLGDVETHVIGDGKFTAITEEEAELILKTRKNTGGLNRLRKHWFNTSA